jgi:DNA-damage-inducible protein D
VSGHNIPEHFPDVGKTIKMPQGAEKEIDDLMLTRYACYLIALLGAVIKQSLITFASNQAKIFVASRLFKDNIGQFFFCLR